MTQSTEDYIVEGHPIRATIAIALRDGQPGQEPAQLSQEALQTIRDEMKKWIGRPELADCVEMVLAIALALEQEKQSPMAASALIQLCDEPDVLAALRDLNARMEAERSEAVVETAEKFVGFTDNESTKTAPKSDQKAPKGSTKLGNLDFPKKL